MHENIREDCFSSSSIICRNCPPQENENIIDDHITGDTICLNCGLVVSPAFSTFSARSCDIFDTRNWMDPDREKIKNILALIFIEGSAIEDEALSILRVLKSKLFAQGKNISNQNKSITAYAIWEACNKRHQPRDMNEIAIICGVKMKHILQIEKTLELTQTYMPATEFVERIIDTLHLPYWFGGIVKRILKSNQILCAHKPINSIAVVIIQLVKLLQDLSLEHYEEKKDHLIYYFISRAKNDTKLNLKKFTTEFICSTLDCSFASCYRLSKKISIPHLLNILENEKINVY